MTKQSDELSARNDGAAKPSQLSMQLLQEQVGALTSEITLGIDMPVLDVAASNLLQVAGILRDCPQLQMQMLVDVCGVDYLEYGCSQWRTEQATTQGFSRAASKMQPREPSEAWSKPRFAVVYHLLSLEFNWRLRMRCFLADEQQLQLPSVVDIWPSANWYERETYDLFGIEFTGHPDLRRLLTDYGFKGHPFRKDFPLIGEVEMRYDATLQRCVYEPVSIAPRVLVPKVIRKDNRYLAPESGNDSG